MEIFGTTKIAVKDGVELEEKLKLLKYFPMTIFNIKTITPDATDTNHWFEIYYSRWCSG